VENSKLLKSILFVAGSIGIGIGTALLLVPVSLHSTSGIDLGGNISLLSETRAPGGALLAIGTLILLGAFVPRLTFTSAVVATVTYLAYGLSRVLSMAVDGRPADVLVQAAVAEIAIGLVCLAALIKFREPNSVANESAPPAPHVDGHR